MHKTRQLRIFEDTDSLSGAAARFILDETERTIAERGNANVILAGGSTPRVCYEILASAGNGDRLRKVNWFIGDERWVATDDPESNERMIRTSLFGKTPNGCGTLYSWNACSKGIHATVKTYGDTVGGILDPDGGRPDLLLLGLGDDGHTASLFPGSLVLHENGELVPLSPDIPGYAAAVYVPQKKTWRLTLTPAILNKSDVVLFLVTGASKRESLGRLLKSGDGSAPASWIRGNKILYFASADVVDEKTFPADSFPAVYDLQTRIRIDS